MHQPTPTKDTVKYIVWGVSVLPSNQTPRKQTADPCVRRHLQLRPGPLRQTQRRVYPRQGLCSSLRPTLGRSLVNVCSESGCVADSVPLSVPLSVPHLPAVWCCSLHSCLSLKQPVFQTCPSLRQPVFQTCPSPPRASSHDKHSGHKYAKMRLEPGMT